MKLRKDGKPDGRGAYARSIPEEMSRRGRLAKKASPWSKGPNCKTPKARESWEKIRAES